METEPTFRVRDPGAAVTADDIEHRLPYHTRQRMRPPRGPRSVAAALAELRLDSTGGERFAWDRFCGTTWTSVFFSDRHNRKTHPAEEFFRFSAFRYIVSEAQKNARVRLIRIAEVLLGSADLEYRLKRFSSDVSGDELPDLYTCSEAAVAAYNAGWLRYLSCDWMADEGAEAVLHLINLRSCCSEPGGTAATAEAFGLGKLKTQVDVEISRVREARLEIGRHAKLAFNELRVACPALNSAAATWPIARPPKDDVAKRTRISPTAPAATALRDLYTLLRQAGRSVRWDVNTRAGAFLRQLRELSEDLTKAAEPSQLQEEMLAVGWTLASLQTGISMRELARQLGGGNFFQKINFGSESDWDEDAPALT
jgi:hypothetical protein